MPAVARLPAGPGPLGVHHPDRVLVGADHVVPHSERHEDVRGHVLGVTRVRRRSGQLPRGVESAGGMVRVIDGVNQVVGRTRVGGVPPEDRLDQVGGAGVGAWVAHSLVESEQRQGVEQGDLVIAGMGLREPVHGGLVERVATSLGPVAVEQLDRVEEAGLARGAGLGPAGLGGRTELGQGGPGRIGLLLVPDGVVPGHRFAPVGQGQAGIGGLGLPEGVAGLGVMKEVEEERPSLEGQAGVGDAGGDRKAQRAEAEDAGRRLGLAPSTAGGQESRGNPGHRSSPGRSALRSGRGHRIPSG